MGSRILFDVSGLVQWYAYLSNPSGIQRVMEGILGLPLVTSDPDIVFAARAIGSDAFYVVPADILTDLTLPATRRGAIARLRGLFGRSMRLADPLRLAREMSSIHLPYVGLGFSFTDRLWESYCAGRWTATSDRVTVVSSSDEFDALVGLGDFWCHRQHVRALIDLKARHGSSFVHLIHDLFAAHSPQWTHPHYGKEFLDQLVLLAPHVDRWLATSRFVSDQITAYLTARSMTPRPIETIAMGWPRVSADSPDTRAAEESILEKFDLQRGEYLLHVGTVEPRKNLDALFDALIRIGPDAGGQPVRCVLVGRDGWRSDVVHQRLKTEPALRRVLWIKDAPDTELAALYRAAKFTVLPSFAEGWGLAVQESLAHGTPCIASSAGGTREAGLDLAEYVDSRDSAALARAIEVYANDTQALAHAREKIRKRLVDVSALPSWTDAAHTVLRAAMRETTPVDDGPDGRDRPERRI